MFLGSVSFCRLLTCGFVSIGQNVLLNEGNFQLPLHQKPPRRSAAMTMKALDESPRVSAATVLVRIKRAKPGDGLSLLSAEGAAPEVRC